MNKLNNSNKQKQQKLILGIETSCDETAAAVVEDGRKIRSNLISSQIDLHARFGGVVPEIASRRHLEIINPLIDTALQEAGVTIDDIDALAVSYGPGLVGALLVGVATAKSLAYARDIPLVAVNHLKGHLYAGFLYKKTGNGSSSSSSNGNSSSIGSTRGTETNKNGTGASDSTAHGGDGENKEEAQEINFPLLGLIASGGHTDLVWMPREDETTILGHTRDDAAGEAFDKVARALGLGYPGGPVIDKLAREGNPKAVALPRAYLKEDGQYDFSFSGLKSAVLNYLRKQERSGETVNLPDLAASFQAAVVEVLVEKTLAAVREKNPAGLILSGGVAANSSLRRTMQQRLAQEAPTVKFHCPPPELCTDNAAMIAAAAFPGLKNGDFAPLNLNAVPNLPL